MANAKQEKNKYNSADSLMVLRSRIQSVYQWRQLEVVWLKQRLNLSNQTIARMLNYKPQTVSFIWQKWTHDPESFFHLNRPGGRKRSYLSFEDEAKFISPFLESAQNGDNVDVKAIKEEYQSLVGREVADSTIYRLLYRHEWKKNRT